VLHLDASAFSEVAPDLAIFTLAIVREGPDVAPLTKDINATLAKAFADAKSVPTVIASNGGYSTFPRYETRNNQNVRNGWTVRAEMIVKSKDFNAIGALVGKLSETMQITGSSFDISPELRAKESSLLVDRAAQAFQDKAAAAIEGVRLRRLLDSRGHRRQRRPGGRSATDDDGQLEAAGSVGPRACRIGPRHADGDGERLRADAALVPTTRRSALRFVPRARRTIGMR